jgi:3,4-dihydroxy 2-butanone 4-phosphate synthase/GTP cyclohydrolase II
MPISPIAEIIEELRRGRMVVVMDDADRENEGDLLIAAECARAEDINFMARHGRGLICLTLTPERCRQLQLPLMVNDNRAYHATKFTVSIEAAQGVTTGISAADRATTVRAAVKRDAKPADLVQPGHVFPLMAQRGGVLARGGHTEAGVDLARLAGFTPASVICEILKEDGGMARLPELVEFARAHNLKIGTIADLIRYRMENESSVKRVAEGTLPTEFGEFRAVAYHDDIEDKIHLALIKGEVRRDVPVLVRVHVHTSLWDLLADMHRVESWTLRTALARVAKEAAGVVVILDQQEPAAEWVKHLHQLQGSLESKPVFEREELRTYGLGSQILADLGVSKMRVLSHPKKAPGISGFGLEVVEYISAETEPGKDKQKSR